MNLNINNQLSIFFKYSYERDWEVHILNGTFIDIKGDVLNYINQLVSIPIEEFIQYVIENCNRQPIVAADVFQFSDFSDATINLCAKILAENNPGVNYKEVGLLLLNDGTQRNDGALNKYGENHIKTAESFGLAFKSSAKVYYLSAIGCVFDELQATVRDELLIRLIIRNKLFTQLFIAAKKEEVDLEAFLYDLSKSTYVRRRTNINKIIELLNDYNEYNFANITKNIIY